MKAMARGWLPALVAVGVVTMGVAWAPVAGQQAPAAAASTSAEEPYRQLLGQYCVGCHNTRAKTSATQSGVVFDTADLSRIAANAGLWENVLRKLHTRAMPPQGARRPDENSYHALTAWLEGELDRAAHAHPHPGRPVLHRLNRAEYANAIRDLLALDVDIAALLPPDDSAYGFDNISDVLGVSPSLQERYLSAAETISSLAVGDVHAAPVTETFSVRQDLSQNQHVEGLPLGTMGGLVIHHTFPVDAEYDLKVRFFRTNFGNLRGLEHPHPVEVALDGRRIRLATIGGDDDLNAAFDKPSDAADAIDARFAVRLPLAAGPHTLTVAFVENLPLADTTRLQPFLRSSSDTLDWTGRPHLDRVTITGPFNVKGPGDTPSRRRVFTCRPTRADMELACAKQIITTLARRAYRQPVTGAVVQPILGFFQQARRDGTFESGVQAALQLILASPKFIFRIEADPATTPSGAVYRISDLELASRLSFFLWSSIPDDELLDVASRGKLTEHGVLEQQVRRMLADPKSDALVSNFAGQWLQLRNLRTLLPNSDEFPDFDDNLRQALQRETELFFGSVIREDRNVLDLMTADYTFVNERLARHYGMPGIYGSQFRRVMVTDEARKGLLGKGSILAVTSHATRTSPVVRGKWILENVLGTPPAPPPPDVPALKENEAGRAPKTVREQMAEHRADPVCASCHKVMDPLGFALENFDAVGAWRTREAGGRIDASGQLSDGTAVDGVVTLRQALLRQPDVFVSTMTEKLLTYALGRGLDDYDMPALRRIVRESAQSNYRFSSLVLGIVESVPFEMREKPPASETTTEH
jgi:mono/diheme cytochrome c family protein